MDTLPEMTPHHVLDDDWEEETPREPTRAERCREHAARVIVALGLLMFAAWLASLVMGGAR